MSRLPQTAVVVALLVATAASFAYTERLKLERSPITATKVDKVFSPVCECVRDVAVVSFVLRSSQTVTVEIDGSKPKEMIKLKGLKGGSVRPPGSASSSGNGVVDPWAKKPPKKP